MFGIKVNRNLTFGFTSNLILNSTLLILSLQSKSFSTYPILGSGVINSIILKITLIALTVRIKVIDWFLIYLVILVLVLKFKIIAVFVKFTGLSITAVI